MQHLCCSSCIYVAVRDFEMLTYTLNGVNMCVTSNRNQDIFLSIIVIKWSEFKKEVYQTM